MPNNQRHRGQHSDDVKIFNEKWVAILQKAVNDLSFLLSNGYAEKSSLKLVGDRYKLNARQRQALLRGSCGDQACSYRIAHQLQPAALQGAEVVVDGYNLLIITEVALSNGIILACKDKCYRDIASIHGTYKRVEETVPAIQLIGSTFQQLGVSKVHWYFDSPVSNSGRLKQMLLDEATQQGWAWEAELVYNPDKALVETGKIVVSSDGWVIDNSKHWFNMMAYLLDQKLLVANVKDVG
ncbi:DUF434 domain-containing protein [Microscilla marina]|uniref:DUF434 domain-containing protein n=1 Tax=Microscilla marina ATCC 23134 TaxID=313606 RepID=A1ZSY9_MICM2|nr:DUF434 domain-containing protein [Microscilla marina]EAY26553.1 conserved hypothetical protein [Microscilla marina ATCC 23134]